VRENLLFLEKNRNKQRNSEIIESGTPVWLSRAQPADSASPMPSNPAKSNREAIRRTQVSDAGSGPSVA
jgi:hypothetical protein